MINLWPFKRKKSDDDILIKNGEIIDADLPTINNKALSNKGLTSVKLGKSELYKDFIQPKETEKLEKIIQPEVDQKLDKFANIELKPNTFYPPTTPIYNTTFLCDTPDGGDLGLYLHYLETEGKKERTKAQYMIDLRIWKQELKGLFPTPELIQQIINDLKPHRAHRLVSVLKSYGKYRNHHGDPRLVVMFASALNIKKPAIPPPKDREILTKEQLKLYRASARELCRDGNRVGIWIGLTLLGVKSQTIKYVDTDGQNLIVKNGDNKKLKAPAWLIRAVQSIPREKWVRSRNAIRKGVKHYGITPNDLYYSAVHHASNGNGRRKKAHT